MLVVTFSLPLHLHVTEAARLSNLRPLRGKLHSFGGPDMLRREKVGDNVQRPDHIPRPQDYESALRAGLRTAQELLQEESETGE